MAKPKNIITILKDAIDMRLLLEIFKEKVEMVVECPQCKYNGAIYKIDNGDYICSENMEGITENVLGKNIPKLRKKCSVLDLYRRLFPYKSIKTVEIDEEHPFC